MKRKNVIAVCMAALLGVSILLQGCGKDGGTGNVSEMDAASVAGETGAVEASAPAGNGAEDAAEGAASGTDAAASSAETEGETADAAGDDASLKAGAEAEAGGEEIAVPSACGALRVEGTQLTDRNGNAVQLKGISTHGIAWFPDYVNEECFRQLRREWNVNVIRLAMYTAENDGYCTDGDQEELKQLVRDGVEYATAQDMYVIIDWHILSDGNPNTYLSEAMDFFEEMSAEYADHDNVIYEICNEPNGGTGWSDIKAYAEKVIEVIRDNDEDGIILVGTPNWSQYVEQAAADPITGYSNIMYTLHFYAATHTDWLRNAMTAAIDAGLPVFVSEYGICDASGNGAIDEHQANLWVDAMDACGVSYVAWNLSNKNETSAVISSGCSKTSGFTESDLSASGKWLFQMLTGDGAADRAEDAGTAGRTTDAGASSSSDTGQGSTASGDGRNAGSTAGNSSADTSEMVFTDGGISCTAVLKNSWESEGKFFYQYDLTLENTSGADCDSWAIDVEFSDAITLSDGWNGAYTEDDSVLHIASKDYNGSIKAGDTVKEVGFIISGSKDLKIAE